MNGTFVSRNSKSKSPKGNWPIEIKWNRSNISKRILDTGEKRQIVRGKSWCERRSSLVGATAGGESRSTGKIAAWAAIEQSFQRCCSNQMNTSVDSTRERTIRSRNNELQVHIADPTTTSRESHAFPRLICPSPGNLINTLSLLQLLSRKHKKSWRFFYDIIAEISFQHEHAHQTLLSLVQWEDRKFQSFHHRWRVFGRWSWPDRTAEKSYVDLCVAVRQ